MYCFKYNTSNHVTCTTNQVEHVAIDLFLSTEVSPHTVSVKTQHDYKIMYFDLYDRRRSIFLYRRILKFYIIISPQGKLLMI